MSEAQRFTEKPARKIAGRPKFYWSSLFTCFAVRPFYGAIKCYFLFLFRTNLLVLKAASYFLDQCCHSVGLVLKFLVNPCFLDSCAEQRTYEKFHGLMAQRFCQSNRAYVESFEKIFVDCYKTIYRLISFQRLQMTLATPLATSS